MSDDRWNPTPPGWKPIPERTARPRELVFEFVDRLQRRCRVELIDHGDAGAEAQIISGDFDGFVSRRWPSRELAIAWAEQQRMVLERGR